MKKEMLKTMKEEIKKDGNRESRTSGFRQQ
jgi:hypothetical protein